MTRRFEHVIMLVLLAALVALLLTAMAAPQSAEAATASSAAKQTTVAKNSAARSVLRTTQKSKKCSSSSDTGDGPVRPAMITPLAVSAMTAACAKSVSLVDDLTGLPGKAVDGALGLVGDAVSSVASSVGGSMMDQIAGWMGKQASGLVKSVMEKVRKSTSPHVAGPKAKWFKQQYVWMMGLASFLAALVVIFAVMTGALKADIKEIAQTAFINWPLAFILMGATLGITQMALDFTDELCKQVITATGNDMRTVFTTIAGSLSADGKTNPMIAAPGGGLLVIITSLVAMMGTLLIWVELIMREAAVYLVLFFFPLGMAISIWPKFKRTRQRAITLLIVAVVSKFFILAIFGLGAAMIATGTSDDITRILSGVFVMFVAATVPMLLMKFLPFDEIADFAQRPRMPQAAQQAANNGLSQMLSRGSQSGGGGGEASTGNGPGGGGGGGGGGDVPSTSGRGGGGGAAKMPGSGGGAAGAKAGGAGGGEAGAGAGAAGAAGAVAAPVAVAAAGAAMAAKRAGQQAGPAMQGTASEADTIAGGGGGADASTAFSPAATSVAPPTDVSTTSGVAGPSGATSQQSSNGAAPPPHIAARQTTGANVAAEGGIPVA